MPGKYTPFIINENKLRIIMSVGLYDKVINHFITRYCLEKKLAKYLDIRNVATRKGMGTDYGIRLIKRDIEENKKYGKFYFLKLDISPFT